MHEKYKENVQQNKQWQTIDHLPQDRRSVHDRLFDQSKRTGKVAKESSEKRP
jgi:hypothetical protein